MCAKCNVQLYEDQFFPYNYRWDNNRIHSSTIDDEIGEINKVIKLLFNSLYDPTKTYEQVNEFVGFIKLCL